MKYRSEIDGLRALAVVPVIFFHAQFEFFRGGFIGVDVFFVISGYLITTIIHDEIQKGTFSLANFYERRVRRILPALFFICLVCILFAWLWMFPSQYNDFSLSIIATNLFSSNILFWIESSYFSPNAELKPLLHTWSLAVEEQFYVFFPLFLLLFRKFRVNQLLVVLAIVAVLSLALSEYGATKFPIANFYLLPTRAWELGVGALLAISPTFWCQTRTSISQWMSALGLGMIVYSVLFFDKTTPFPGCWGLIPVLGTALVIAYAKTGTLVARLLSWKPVVGLGLISYSAYLWHQPLFVFARMSTLDHVDPESYLVLSGCSFLFAYLTWRFIEAPFRNKKNFTRFQIFGGAIIASGVFVGFGLVGYFKADIPSRLPEKVTKMDDWSKDIDTRRNKCLPGYVKDLNFPKKECIYNPEFKLSTAIWGDSYAAAIANELAKALAQNHLAMVQLSFKACPPALGIKRSDKYTKCDVFNSAAFQYLVSGNIGTIILIARWDLYLEGTRFNNGEGGIEPGANIYGLPVDKSSEFIKDENRIEIVGKLYRSTIDALLRNGKRVVLIYPVPPVGWNVPNYMARKILFNHEIDTVLSTRFTAFQKRMRNTHTQLNMLGEHPDLLKIFPENVFCNTLINERCIAQSSDKPLYYDDNHLNSIGSAMLSTEIIKEMKSAGWIE